jgi:serine/threonine protein kinase
VTNHEVIGPDWWTQVSPYLDEALQLSGAERTGWLVSLRSRQPDIAARVEALLAEHEQLAQARFLEHAPSPFTVGTSLAGRSVGAYTLRAPIGEGGMGSVWLAERSDGEIQQRVAIKFVGTGDHRPGWRERFLRERQLLASLSHPSIVRVMDAGHTEDGRPYLVMEYVEGRPIDAYAVDLSLRDRLELFLRVCDGISHAHRHLIIHRDLKPSNILVDDARQPKLLDFGIAKLLDDTGDSTQTIDRLLTPSYASPEQFRGGAHTTATDVYSLGAILYKLTTGRSPHDSHAPGVHRMAAIAGAADIPAPTCVNAALPSDLDYIVRKALREEAEERYVSVDAFANDVRHLLDSKPIEARSGDGWYRARKFVRRHRIPVGAAAAVLASLSAGLYYANRERTIAERRFRQVRQLANTFIALDGEIRGLPGSTAARNRIVSESLKYLATLGNESHDDPELALEIGNAYLQVARVQGVPIFSNLGQYADAEESLRKAAKILELVLRNDAANRGARLVAAQIERDWMALVDYQHRRAEALVHAQNAAGHLDRFLKAGKATPDEINTATHIYSNLGVAYSNSNRLQETIEYSRRAADISVGVEKAAMRRASALGVMSIALRRVGDLEGALAAARESSGLLQEGLTAGAVNQQFNASNALFREALVLGESAGPSLVRPSDALALFQKAWDLTEDLASKDPLDSQCRIHMAIVGRQMGDVLRHTDPARALVLYERALVRIREAVPTARVQCEEAALLAVSSYALRALQRTEDGKQRIEAAFRIFEETNQYPADSAEPGGEVQDALCALADHYADTGDRDKAIATYEELVAMLGVWDLRLDDDLRDAAAVSRAWASLERLLNENGRPEGGRALHTARAALWRKWQAKLPDNVFVRHQVADLDRVVFSPPFPIF